MKHRHYILILMIVATSKSTKSFQNSLKNNCSVSAFCISSRFIYRICRWIMEFPSQLLYSLLNLKIIVQRKFHGIIESQGWKEPTRSSSPTVLPLPLLPQATKPYLVASHPDASWMLPGTATPPPPWAGHSSTWPLSKRKSFYLSKPPLVQLVAISSGPVCSSKQTSSS